MYTIKPDDRFMDLFKLLLKNYIQNRIDSHVLENMKLVTRFVLFRFPDVEMISGICEFITKVTFLLGQETTTCSDLTKNDYEYEFFVPVCNDGDFIWEELRNKRKDSVATANEGDTENNWKIAAAQILEYGLRVISFCYLINIILLNRAL